MLIENKIHILMLFGNGFEAVKHMKVFRITGGESCYPKHTLQVVQYLIDNPILI